MKVKYYSTRNALSYLFFALFLVSFVLLIGSIYKSSKDKVDAKKRKDSFIKIMKKAKTPEEEIKFLQKEYNNKNILAVLSIPSLNIYQPVVKGRDNYYYLNRGLDNKYLLEGSIFLDYRNSINDKQINIYGHSSPDITLDFNKLFKYRDKDFLASNKEVLLKRNNEIIKYEVIYTIPTHDNEEHMHLKFNNNAAWLKHYNALRSLSEHKEVLLKAEDEILVMQTCLQGREKGMKLAVVARRIK